MAGQPSTYPKADGTGHLHVGDTNNNNGVQRGLLQFYFDPDVIPANAIVTDVSLTMTVADVPNRVLQRDINFWMVAMEGLSGQWAQGPGNEQSPAVPGDTTWFHTKYDPAVHGELGNADNPLRDFTAGDPGYWPAPGYFGQEDLLDTAPGEGVGGPFDDTHALVFSEGSGIGDMVNWSNDRMLSDVQAWVDGSMDNFGWILIGEEWITEDQTGHQARRTKLANASSKIDFFSSETAGPLLRPAVVDGNLPRRARTLFDPASGDGPRYVLVAMAQALVGSHLPSLVLYLKRGPRKDGQEMRSRMGCEKVGGLGAFCSWWARRFLFRNQASAFSLEQVIGQRHLGVCYHGSHA